MCWVSCSAAPFRGDKGDLKLMDLTIFQQLHTELFYIYIYITCIPLQQSIVKDKGD